MTLHSPGWHRAEAEKFLEMAKTSPSGWKHLDPTDLLIVSRTHAELGHGVDAEYVDEYKFREDRRQKLADELFGDDDKIAEDTTVQASGFSVGDVVLASEYFDGPGTVLGFKDGIVFVDKNGAHYSLFAHELNHLDTQPKSE